MQTVGRVDIREDPRGRDDHGGDRPLHSVRMRASAGGAHVSGAERIVALADVPRTVDALVRRALGHPKGAPDFVNVTVEAIAEPLRVPALPVATETVATPEEGWLRVGELLAGDGFSRAAEIRARFRETYAMRGAMLLDADTLERLEPDPARGVRATRMDACGASEASSARSEVRGARGASEASSARSEANARAAGFEPSNARTANFEPANAREAGSKNHFREALVLASKVQAAPGIVAEICMSDDPDYVTGYVASKSLGYRRITVLKERGDPSGGRIFLFRGPRALVPACIRFLQEQAVLVEGVPDVLRITGGASAKKKAPGAPIVGA